MRYTVCYFNHPDDARERRVNNKQEALAIAKEKAQNHFAVWVFDEEKEEYIYRH